MGQFTNKSSVIRYRGFVILEQPEHKWLVRPERSPMMLLPFRTPSCSLADVKIMLDQRLSDKTFSQKAA